MYLDCKEQSLARSLTQVGFHVRFILFVSNCNQNWNVSTNASERAEYEILLKSVEWSRSYMCGWTDRNGKINIFFSQFYTKVDKIR